MQRILVTGATGFIGRHLVASLSQEGMIVRGFARTPKPADLLPIVEWMQGDVRHLADVQQAASGCNTVVHLACLPLGPSFENPLSDFEVNAAGTLNVLQAAYQAGVRRVVYTSTAQVYGYVKHLPLLEEHPTQPNSPYAASKLCGEILCTTFSRCYGLDTIVLRLFNVYGSTIDQTPRKTVENIFIQRVSKGLPPIIKGDTEEARDFIHISDVIRAIRLALDPKVSTPEIINIGTGVMTTLWQLAGLIINLAQVELNPVIEPTDTRPLRIQADVSKAKQLLNFKAEVPLAVGLAKMLETKAI